MIPGVVKDTRSSILELHKMKSIWMAQGSPYVPRLKISTFWNECKAVKNPPVLYVINARVVEDTGGSIICISWVSPRKLKC